jgi:hypothetical protein
MDGQLSGMSINLSNDSTARSSKSVNSKRYDVLKVYQDGDQAK